MDVNLIKSACHLAMSVRAYWPANGVTHCNEALHHILTDLGYPDFAWDVEFKRPMMANDIAEKCETTLQQVPIGDVLHVANDGQIIIATIKEPFHGHCALVYPFPAPQTSGKWFRTDLPCVANVGKDVGVMPVNYAFGTVPRFWRLSK